MQHLKNTPGTRVSHMDGDGRWESGVRKLDELQGTWVSRATSDLTCGLRVCVERSHVERLIVVRARPRRVIIVYSSLLRHAFAAPEFCPMPCYHGYTVTGVVRTQKYETVLVSFRDGRRGAHVENRVARRFGMRETLCVLLQKGSDDMRRRERLRRDYFSLLRSFRVIHSCVCYFN